MDWVREKVKLYGQSKELFLIKASRYAKDNEKSLDGYMFIEDSLMVRDQDEICITYRTRDFVSKFCRYCMNILSAETYVYQEYKSILKVTAVMKELEESFNEAYSLWI